MNKNDDGNENDTQLSTVTDAPSGTGEPIPELTDTPVPTDTPTPEPTATPTPVPTSTPYSGPELYTSTEKNISYTRESHHYAVSENFGKNFSYENTYYITVSLNSQIVKVYKRDSNGNPTGQPVKTFITSTGDKNDKSKATPVTRFVILDNDIRDVSKYRWCYANPWVQYATRLYYINNLRDNGFDGYFTGFMFHSELYSEQNNHTLQAKEWNKLGYPCSHGCMRMQAVDAKWIYENCHSGSIVDVIDGEPEPELWKQLKPALIPENQNYDPTDN